MLESLGMTNDKSKEYKKPFDIQALKTYLEEQIEYLDLLDSGRYTEIDCFQKVLKKIESLGG